MAIIARATYPIKKSLQNKIKKGDLVGYEKHISMVYSDRASCDAGGENCQYEIIHAYGGIEKGSINFQILRKQV